MKPHTLKILILVFLVSLGFRGQAQVNWTTDGDSYYKLENNELKTYTLPGHEPKTVISRAQLTPQGIVASRNHNRGRNLPLRGSLSPSRLPIFRFPQISRKYCCSPIPKGFGG